MKLWWRDSTSTYYDLDTIERVQVIDIFHIIVHLGSYVDAERWTGSDAEEFCGYLQTQVPRSQQIAHFGEEDA